MSTWIDATIALEARKLIYGLELVDTSPPASLNVKGGAAVEKLHLYQLSLTVELKVYI